MFLVRMDFSGRKKRLLRSVFFLGGDYLDTVIMWLETNGASIIDFLQVVLSIILGVCFFIKNKDLSKLKEVLQNMDNKKTFSQSFSNLKPVYRLNQTTGELVKTDEVIDVDELVSSFQDMALQNVIDRLMPSEGANERISIISENQNKIDLMQEAFETAENLKKKYNLDENLSIQDTFNYLKKYNEDMKLKVNELTQNLEVKKQEKQIKNIKDGEENA